MNSPALYKGKISKNYSIYADKEDGSKRLYNAKKEKDVKVDRRRKRMSKSISCMSG